MIEATSLDRRMNSGIQSIEEEILTYFQNEGCTTAADYSRASAFLLYQERQRCKALSEQLADLKRKKRNTPMGSTLAGAAADQFLTAGYRGQGESEQEFLNRKLNEQDDNSETPSEYLARKARE